MGPTNDNPTGNWKVEYNTGTSDDDEIARFQAGRLPYVSVKRNLKPLAGTRNIWCMNVNLVLPCKSDLTSENVEGPSDIRIEY